MAQPRNISVESTLDDDAGYKPSWANAESEDRLSRRRSVECSATRISISQTEHHQDHTVYVIRVITSMRSWTIKRRYRDFYYLDKELTKQYPNMQFPALPPKRYLRSSSDPEIVDQRREQLEQYLNGLVRIPQVWARNDFVLFLNDDSNIMTFIWNFERMRKLQDMLNALKLANLNETTKLTNDLNVATSQVKVLQARLSQMEMIFLQQATGMASQQLPSDVLRTLSGVESSLSSLTSQLRSEVTAEHADLYQDKVVSPVKDREGSSAPDDSSVFAVGEMNEEGAENAVPVEEVVRALNLAQDGGSAGIPKPRTAEDARAYAMSLQFQEAIHLSNQLLPQKMDIGLSPSPEKSRRPPSYDYHPSRKSPIISAKFVSTASENAFHQTDLQRSWIEAGDVESLSDLSNWTRLFSSTVDVIITAMLPTEQTTANRHQVFKYIRDLVSTTIGCQLFPTGSLVSQCFLPDGGIDCTAFVPKMADDSWFVKINEALCLSAFGGSETPTSVGGAGAASERVAVSNVSFVHDEIKMIRSMINNFSVTISTNQLTSIYAEALIERINLFVGKNNLFKRSAVLLKAWFQYESARYSNGGGCLVGLKDSRLPSWSVIVLLIYIFNIKGASITHPLQALGHFFAYYSSFDWSNLIMTVKGPAFRTEDNTLAYITDSRASAAAGSGGKFFPDEIFDFYRTANADYLNWNLESSEAAVDVNAASGDEDQSPSPVPGTGAGSAATSQPSSPSHADSSSPIPPPAAATTSAATQAQDLAAQMHNTDSLHFHSDYRFGPFNLINPVDRSQNLLAPLEEIGLAAFVSALHEGYKHFQSICEELSKAKDASSTTGSASGAGEVAEKTNKLIRRLFANSCLKVGLDSFSKMTAWVDNWKSQSPFDGFRISSVDLQFSLSYGQLALGGKVDQRLLLHLIVIILDKKGSMPVGEIGKNLQALLCCDNLSKRLKEQFGGLKKAIERSTFTELRMGTEHPFNPIVTLLGDSPILASDQQEQSRPGHFAHAAFLYTPYSVSLQLQAQALKEAQLAQAKTHSKSHKPKYSNYNSMNSAVNAAAYAPHPYMDGLAHSPYGSYPPPFLAVPMNYPAGMYVDTGSASTSPKRGGQGGSGGQLSPPTGMYYAARGPPAQSHPSSAPQGRMGMGQAPMHSMPMPIPAPYPGMPMYTGPNGQPMYPPPMAFSPTGPPPPYYMHCSLPGSLSSSYGGPPGKLHGMGDNHGENA